VRPAATSQSTGARDLILVWIDGREATIVRHRAAGPSMERIFARQPGCPHPTGRLRRNATARHGEDWKSAADRRREGQLEAFLTEVARRLDPDADLRVIGPGRVHDRLARQVQASDARHGRDRSVTIESAERLTARQLQARLREAVDEGPASDSTAIR
jgi:hypothetical protein